MGAVVERVLFQLPFPACATPDLGRPGASRLASPRPKSKLGPAKDSPAARRRPRAFQDDNQLYLYHLVKYLFRLLQPAVQACIQKLGIPDSPLFSAVNKLSFWCPVIIVLKHFGAAQKKVNFWPKNSLCWFKKRILLKIKSILKTFYWEGGILLAHVWVLPPVWC